jgi:hypothetical protein
MIVPRLFNSMLHDGTVVIVHTENVTLDALVGLSLFPLESPQVLGHGPSKSGSAVLLATRKYHSH